MQQAVSKSDKYAVVKKLRFDLDSILTSIRQAFDCLLKVIKVTETRAANPLATCSHADIYLGRSAAARSRRRSSNGRSAVELQSNCSQIEVETISVSLVMAWHCAKQLLSSTQSRWHLFSPQCSPRSRRLLVSSYWSSGVWVRTEDGIMLTETVLLRSCVRVKQFGFCVRVWILAK